MVASGGRAMSSETHRPREVRDGDGPPKDGRLERVWRERSNSAHSSQAERHALEISGQYGTASGKSRRWLRVLFWGVVLSLVVWLALRATRGA